MVAFDSFGEFVAADPTGGLGTSADRIKRLVEGTDAQGPVGRMLKGEIEPAGPVGRPGGETEKQRTTLISETAERHLARLKRDDPTLAEQVVNGDIELIDGNWSVGFYDEESARNASTHSTEAGN